VRCHGCAALVQQNRVYIALPTRVPSAEERESSKNCS